MNALADQWLCADCCNPLYENEHGPVYSEAAGGFVEVCRRCLSLRVQNMGTLATPHGMIGKAGLNYAFLRMYHRRRPAAERPADATEKPSPAMRPVTQLHTARAARNKAKRKRRRGR